MCRVPARAEAVTVQQRWWPLYPRRSPGREGGGRIPWWFWALGGCRLPLQRRQCDSHILIVESAGQRSVSARKEGFQWIHLAAQHAEKPGGTSGQVIAQRLITGQKCFD